MSCTDRLLASRRFPSLPWSMKAPEIRETHEKNQATSQWWQPVMVATCNKEHSPLGKIPTYKFSKWNGFLKEVNEDMRLHHQIQAPKSPYLSGIDGEGVQQLFERASVHRFFFRHFHMCTWVWLMFLRISSAKVTYQVQHFFPCQYSIEDGPGSEVICDLSLVFVSPKSFGKSFSENYLWQCQKWDFQHLTVERPLRRTSKNLKAGKVAGTTKSHKTEILVPQGSQSWGQDIFKINRLRTFLLPSKSPPIHWNPLKIQQKTCCRKNPQLLTLSCILAENNIRSNFVGIVTQENW